jgi:hypothetical protein
MNAVEAQAGVGSTGVGVGVAASPNRNALLGGSAVVDVGRPNMNPPLAVVLVAAGARTSVFGASTGAGAARGPPKAKPIVVLGASVAPITEIPNGFGSAAFDLTRCFIGKASGVDVDVGAGAGFGVVEDSCTQPSAPTQPKSH